MLTTSFFELSVKQYIRRFGLLLIAAVAGFGVLTILEPIVGRYLPADPKVAQLVNFLRIAQPIWLVFISFFVSRRIYAKREQYKAAIFGQGLICGIAGGLLIGITLSLIAFVGDVFRLKDVNSLITAMIDLVSFLWTSWKYVFLLTAMIDGFSGVRWLMKGFHHLKEELLKDDEIDAKSKSGEETNKEKSDGA
jgi:hypothetical protein